MRNLNWRYSKRKLFDNDPPLPVVDDTTVSWRKSQNRSNRNRIIPRSTMPVPSQCKYAPPRMQAFSHATCVSTARKRTRVTPPKNIVSQRAKSFRSLEQAAFKKLSRPRDIPSLDFKFSNNFGLPSLDSSKNRDFLMERLFSIDGLKIVIIN